MYIYIGKEKKVSVTALKAWSNVVEMLEDKGVYI
jgi:hypothetical protein